MPTLQRLEVWTDFQCNSGTRQAVLPLDHCMRITTTERVEHDDSATIELSKDAAAAAYLALGYVVRFLFDDATFSEWRIRSLEDTSKTARLVRVTLQPPLFDLNTGAAPLTATTGTVVSFAVEYKAMTPSAILAAILAFCPTWWAAGTVTPTVPVSVVAEAWMPLQALRALVAAINAAGTACELHYRRNGTTGYYVDLVTAIGSSESTLDVRTAKNLLGTTRRQDRERYATEVVPVGTGSPKASIGRAWWECTAKSGTTLTMAQPVTGGDMLAFDDQLNTARYLVDDAGAYQQITDCTAGATQHLVVASAANVTAGRWYRIANDASGTEMVGLRKAASTAGPIYVLSSSGIGPDTNFVPNPAMRDWSGAAPDGWTAAGFGTYTKITTAGLWVYGGQSCLMVNSNLAPASLTSPLAGCYIPTTWTGYVIASVWLRPKTWGNAAVVRATLSGGSAGTTGLANFADVTSASYAVDTWYRIDKSVALTASTRGSQKFNIKIAFTGADSITQGEVYVDSAQVVVVATDAAPEFLEGSDPARLWALGNNWLTAYGTTPASYTCTFADLGQWDPLGFPHETVALGQTATVRDTDLDITTSGRVREVTRDWRNPLASVVTIANRPSDLITSLTGIA